MRTRLVHLIGWLSTRLLALLGLVQAAIAVTSHRLMRIVHSELVDHYEAVAGQQLELSELKALDAAFEIKKMASDDEEGWVPHHGIGLNMVADVLQQQHDWTPEDVNRFVQELTDETFSYGSINNYND